MNATVRDTSNRYEKVDENVFRMKPLGKKPRGKILTEFGWVVLLLLAAGFCLGVVVASHLLR